MKRILRNGLSFLLVAVLLLSMFSATAVGLNNGTTENSITTTIDPLEDETALVPIVPESSKIHVLYSWIASSLEIDAEVFSSNLSDESDLRQRWNESAVMYTQREVKQVKLHNFLNQVGTDANGTYGLNPGEDLKVDVYPQVSTDDLKAVALSFVYAHKANENDLNPANSGLLRVYASEDGQNWSEDYVGVRSAYILGIGTGENDENIIYYHITTENLMSLAGLDSGDEISMLRIMPDGESGMCGGTFALYELTVTGYETESVFESNVPAYIRGAVTLDEDDIRESLVETARNSDANSSLGRIQDALALVTDRVPDSARDFWNAAGIAVADGIDTKAKDTVRELLSQMLEREGEWTLVTIDITDETGEIIGQETVWQEFALTSEKAEQILADYESIETTGHIVKDLNTPQQIFRAYASAKPGDLLLWFTQTEAEVYMITGSEVEFLPDGVNVDFAQSTMTYLTATGEHTQTFLDMFAKQEFVPLTVSNLLTWNLDAYASAADGVKVAVVSNRVVDKCVITVGDTAVTMNDLDMAAPICSDPELDAAVAELGEGTHQMTVTVTNDLGTTRTIEVEFEVEENPELFSIYNANMELGDSLTMYFYLNQADVSADKDYYVTVTKTYAEGRDSVVRTIAREDWVSMVDGDVPVYRVGFGGIAAKEMTDDLKVQVFTADGVPASNELTYNIRDYAMTMLNYYTQGELATLFVDMLNYGAQAQRFFEYNVDDLANAWLTQAQQDLATQNVVPSDDSRNVGEMYYNVSLQLESQILLQMYFTGVTSDMYAKVSFTDHYGKEKSATVPFEKFIHVDGSNYYVNVEGLAVADGKQLVTCDIYNGEHVLVGSGTDSVEGYIATMNEVAPDLLYTQIMKFIDSAHNYFH